MYVTRKVRNRLIEFSTSMDITCAFILGARIRWHRQPTIFDQWSNMRIHRLGRSFINKFDSCHELILSDYHSPTALPPFNIVVGSELATASSRLEIRLHRAVCPSGACNSELMRVVAIVNIVSVFSSGVSLCSILPQMQYAFVSIRNDVLLRMVSSISRAS